MRRQIITDSVATIPAVRFDHQVGANQKALSIGCFIRLHAYSISIFARVELKTVKVAFRWLVSSVRILSSSPFQVCFHVLS